MKRLSHISGSKIIQGKGTGTPSTNHVSVIDLSVESFLLRRCFVFVIFLSYGRKINHYFANLSCATK